MMVHAYNNSDTMRIIGSPRGSALAKYLPPAAAFTCIGAKSDPIYLMTAPHPETGNFEV